jgi:hypothetical protein
MRSNQILTLRPLTCLVMLACAFAGACKKRPEPSQQPATAKPAIVAAPAFEIPKAPPTADPDLWRALHKMPRFCRVNVEKSQMTCDNEYVNNIVKIYERGMKQRREAMQTFAHVLEHSELPVKTAAVELMSRAFVKPVEQPIPHQDVTRRLLAQLEKLPEPQAMDAAPAIATLAGQAALEAELFKILDRLPDQRVAVVAYREIMRSTRMRSFQKVTELVGSKNIDLAVAAVEAPRAMGELAPPERTPVCDWMKSLMKDARPLVQVRAAGFLAECGSSYLDFVLVDDEKRLSSRQPLNGGVGLYRNVCNQGDKTPASRATKSQCARIKRLAINVANNAQSREPERVQALELLADQFPGKDTLAVATRLTEGGESILARRAQDAVRDLGRAQNQKSN